MIYDFRLDILRNYVKIGEARVDSCSIIYNSEADCSRGIKTDLKEIRLSRGIEKFEMFSDRLRPVLISNGKEHPLGIYMIISAPRSVSETHNFYSVEAYDETMLLKQAKLERRLYYAAGTKYLNIVQALLTSLGFANIAVEDYNAALANDIEFAVGRSYLEVINVLLDAISYKHVHTDLNGNIVLAKQKNPTEPDFIYSDVRNFKIIPPIELGTDIYDLPNVVVGVYSSPDTGQPITYTKINDDPQSLISTVRRGYKVVKVVKLESSASLADLQDYVETTAFQAMQSTETVKFKTAAEGGHEYGCAVQIDTDQVKGLYVEKGWTMDLSARQFGMVHTVERKVLV